LLQQEGLNLTPFFGHAFQQTTFFTGAAGKRELSPLRSIYLNEIFHEFSQKRRKILIPVGIDFCTASRTHHLKRMRGQKGCKNWRKTSPSASKRERVQVGTVATTDLKRP
jgi:hypothetical protein